MADDARNASGTPAPTASHAGHSGGHVVSSRATAVGLMAIVLWSFMTGTVRIVAESFGATLGSALIYTVGGVLLLVFRRPAPIREFPKKYLIIGGLLFVFYESSISLSLGLASTAASSVEVSLVNYLWRRAYPVAGMRCGRCCRARSWPRLASRWRLVVIPGLTGRQPLDT